MKTKYVIQFRSGPLGGQFLGRWSYFGWMFTAEHLIARAHYFDSMTAANVVAMLLDIDKNVTAIPVHEPCNSEYCD
jgi:hypothetical protein